MKIKLGIIIFFSFNTLNPSLASQEDTKEKSFQQLSALKLKFEDNCEITVQQNGDIRIRDGDEDLWFNDEGKTTVHHETGEKLIEYSNLTDNNNKSRSWAKAIFRPSGHSLKHYHTKLAEDYYVISPNAELSVVVEGIFYPLTTGNSIKILPRQTHYAINSSQEDVSVIVKCSPAWTSDDHHIVPSSDEYTPTEQ